jgi:YegS/Rv2252/BmrU family lipid kinase
MHGKNVCLVVDLRTGEHLAQIPGLIAVFRAAGWKTKVALKEYGGETQKLAQQAARDGYDVVLGYGGDGTLSAVLNGVMNEGSKSLVADIPGGTYNVWAGAIGIPNNPIQAALAVVNSMTHTVDLGHIEVTGVTFPETGEKPLVKGDKKAKRSSRARQHFLLHVGIGLEATMMAHISKPLKYRFGPLAFDLSMLKTLPRQHPFSLEIKQMDHAGNIERQWQGEVWEVFVSKVPLFGGAMNIAPEARADDGLLSVCLITANGPLKTVEQVFSLVTQRKLDEKTTEYFRGAHFSLQVPASMDVHVDGSITQLKDFLHTSEQQTLQQASNAEQVSVTYRFDVEPKAVRMAFPRTYNGALFTASPQKENGQQERDKHESASHNGTKGRHTRKKAEHSKQKTFYEITVIGVAPVPEQQGTSLVAGTYKKQISDETEVVALRIDQHTHLLGDDNTPIPLTTIFALKEGETLVVEGEKSKRNVIEARSVTISSRGVQGVNHVASTL